MQADDQTPWEEELHLAPLKHRMNHYKESPWITFSVAKAAEAMATHLEVVKALSGRLPLVDASLFLFRFIFDFRHNI